MEVKDGLFLMQRVDDQYLGKFHFKADDIKHLTEEFNFEERHSSGENLSAIILRNPKLADGKEIPEIPDLESFDNDDIDEDA